jgi:hypothetical protein
MWFIIIPILPRTDWKALIQQVHLIEKSLRLFAGTYAARTRSRAPIGVRGRAYPACDGDTVPDRWSGSV